MCLLFKKPAAAQLNDEQLADMYSRNQDGYGVMYAVNNTLHLDKGIGKVEDWIKFFRKYEHLDACFHLRMRTHGDIDLTNTHPYPVWGFDDTKGLGKVPVALMHNGILTQGNFKDKSKSDTWHYIRDWVRPLTLNDQSVIFTKQFIELIGEHIGTGNKFAMMDAYGNIAIVNEDAGVRWNGMWFSNTYAWSARDNKLYPGINVHTYTYGGGYNRGLGSLSDWEMDDDDRYTKYWNGHANVPNDPRKPVTTEITETTTKGVTTLTTKDGAVVTYSKNPDGSVQKTNPDGSITTYPGNKIHRLPQKTKPNAAGKGKHKRGNKRPITNVVPKALPAPRDDHDTGLTENDEQVISHTVSSMFKRDVGYLRSRLLAAAKFVSDGIADKMIEDNVSKFGVEALDDMIADYERGEIFGIDLREAFGNHDKMKKMIYEMYDLDPNGDGLLEGEKNSTKH